ncbi:MAG: ROK family protein [Oscillospiraceae bacterium]|nr:ROK family protein [Oscillospiraceae bacterium]
MLLTSLTEKAKAGEPLWLADLRAAFAAAPGAAPLTMRLTCPDGSERDFSLALPRWETGEEKDFLRRFLCAHAYNLLSAHSGRELRFFCDGPLAALAEELPACFDRPDGLGKVVNVARRVCGGFRFAFSPLSDCAPLPEAPAAGNAALGEALRALARSASSGGIVGLDVGGSDIKLAAALDGRLLFTDEFDWNPAASPTAEGIIEPILSLLRGARAKLEAAGGTLDAVGLSFPDVVIGDRIVGGETPKTRGMRKNPALDYETAFARLRELKRDILALCAPGGRCRICNDGSMAAFTAAMELAAIGEDEAIRGGVIAHSLGTDLGTGWLLADGSIPPIPLEMYDLLLDLGSGPAAALPPEDLRSIRNENSGMPGVRRYLGQAAAYRLAYERDPALLEGFLERRDGVLRIPTEPEDLRKPALQHLMTLASEGRPEAEEIFRRIGRNLAVVAREMRFLFGETPPVRFLFGRFVKSRRCFRLLCEGFDEAGTGIRLESADEEMANTPLMRQLAAREGVTVAQFGQAVGALYFALA